MTKKSYFNIEIDLLNAKETLSVSTRFLHSGLNHLIFFINAHGFNIAQENTHYLEAINNADLLLNDGIGIRMGTRLAGLRVLENMNGSDFIPEVLKLAGKTGKNVFLLGSAEGVAEKARERLLSKFKGISVTGVRNGYFDLDNDQVIIQEIIDAKTEILIVGMGVPKQELWLHRNKDKLHGVKICVAGVAILDFLSGNVRRAPVWMRKLQVEWIFRLILEPRRLFKRYIIGIPLFFYYNIKLKMFYKKPGAGNLSSFHVTD
jgi:N-acetylglucosaminyldiphosphoundecaprenol N-acetyl-beta-D-mannosaminyltransferase